MDLSKFNTRLKLQQRAAGQDGDGELSPMWTDVARVWADVRNQKGLEAVKADVQTSVVHVSVRILYRRGVLPSMRLLHITDGTVYEIKAVLPDTGGKQYIDLVCEVTS
jgi:SPP1 family predicted phage head-tail adaptor